ncbi:MAG: glycosyltransferase [Nitrospirae bacterium]|nr:glycosyltransferase [Nitrospirota bacterium]
METETGDYYRQERREIEALIPENAVKILDVGCGEGFLGKRLLERGVKEVVGIEINPDVCAKAEKHLSGAICGDIEGMELDFEEGYFDCIVLADILEHLKNPQSALKKLGRYLSDSGTVVASIPNIRYWGIINMLIEGRWKYEDYGILDRTHLRFFTIKEMEALFADAGFEITDINANVDQKYYTLNDPGSDEISFGRVLLKGLAKEEMQDLFVVQYLIRARNAKTASALRSYQPSNHINTENRAMKKIAIVRGSNLNKWELQNYEPLSDTFAITAYTTERTCFDLDEIRLPIVKLPFKHQGLLLHMQGLEEQLADKDLVFSADITYLFSAQAVEAKQKCGCKVVCLEWENIPFNYEDYEAVRTIKEYEIVRNIKERVRNGADHFIAVTERAKEALLLEGVPEEKIDVIFMGVDLNKFRPRREDIEKDRERIGLHKDDIAVLFIGRMEWEKGVYDFVHAAAKVLRDNSLNGLPVRFLMVGKGPELPGVQDRARALGISDRITFIEKYPYQEIPRLHNLTDVFVLPSITTKSWQEQFGMVLIESMACGKPVISTFSGSIPEVVGDAGILIQPNDHLSLYGAVKKLILDKDLRECLGKEALTRAEAYFDSRKNAERFRAVFEKVLSRKTAVDGIRDTFDKGMKLYEDGEREKGFQLICDSFEMDPENKETLHTIVKAGKETGKYEIVEKALREYLACHPANLEFLVMLAETLLQSGRREEAEEELKKVFIFDPENGKALSIMEEIKAKQEHAGIAEK